MRRTVKKFKPTVPASEVRARYNWLKSTLVGFIVLYGIAWLLGELFRWDEIIFFVAIPLFVSYVLFCHAFGRLANCFCESTFNWALTAFVFSIFGLALGYFAFKDEVIKAQAENP